MKIHYGPKILLWTVSWKSSVKPTYILDEIDESNIKNYVKRITFSLVVFRSKSGQINNLEGLFRLIQP